MEIAANHTRVSGDRQRESHTIASQTEALISHAREHRCHVEPGRVIQDDGLTGVFPDARV